MSEDGAIALKHVRALVDSMIVHAVCIYLV
jgi:hypothetical protein